MFHIPSRSPAHKKQIQDNKFKLNGRSLLKMIVTNDTREVIDLTDFYVFASLKNYSFIL